jgi:PAS domain-containing protein
MQDQTERKQAEAMLRESEERLRTSETRLLDAQRLAKVGTWELNVETLSLHWSGKTCEIFGVDATPAGFGDFLNHVHTKDREKILETNSKVRSSSAPLEVEYESSGQMAKSDLYTPLRKRSGTIKARCFA